MNNVTLLASFGAAVFSASTLAQTVSPYLQPDDTWISLSGTVESVQQDSFLLDYGLGSVIVEMDDVDRDATEYEFNTGDSVLVSGLVDNDFFEMTTIEASSVYVESVSTFFHASPTDDESITFHDPVVTVHGPIVQGDTTLQGTISAINEEDDEFTLNTGVNMLTVKVDGLDSDPFDDDGYPHLTLQDVVTIRGTITADLFEGRIFEAEAVTAVRGNEQS